MTIITTYCILQWEQVLNRCGVWAFKECNKRFHNLKSQISQPQESNFTTSIVKCITKRRRALES